MASPRPSRVNLREMAVLDTPILVVVTGEGGSGGALGIAVGDTVLMQEYAVYSVIPPEGCAAILWRDPAKKVEAADALKMTAPDLVARDIVDGIIPEPAGGAHHDYDLAASAPRRRALAGAAAADGDDRRRTPRASVREVPPHRPPRRRDLRYGLLIPRDGIAAPCGH